MGSMLLLAIIAAFLVMMLFSSRNAKKRQAEQREKMANEMVPGAWVMTTSGFYGRYVETDGDVVVLETTDGTETLWTSRAIVKVGNPPFAPDAATSGDSSRQKDEDADESDSSVAGSSLDEEETDLSNPQPEDSSDQDAESSEKNEQ